MNRNDRARSALAVAVLVALATPGYADATLYELSWAYKYGSGDIVFDGSVPDSNPDPSLGDHFGSIVSYDVTAWSIPPTPTRLVGDIGTISVQNQEPGLPACPEGGDFCPGASLTFQLGSALPPYDPAGWHLTFSAPRELGNFFDHLPAEGSPPGQFVFFGTIEPNTPSGQLFIPITGGPPQPVTLTALATAVPEPGTAALVGLGLAALAMTRKRRGPQR